MQRWQQPIRCKRKERQHAQPRAGPATTTAQHQRNTHQACRRYAFHDVPGTLADDLRVSDTAQEAVTGTLEPAGKEISDLQDDDVLNGAQTLVNDLRLLRRETRLGMADAQQAITHREVAKRITPVSPITMAMASAGLRSRIDRTMRLAVTRLVISRKGILQDPTSDAIGLVNDVAEQRSAAGGGGKRTVGTGIR